MRGGGEYDASSDGRDNGGSSLDEVDPFFMALLRSRQRRFVECVDICTEILAVNPYDQVCCDTFDCLAAPPPHCDVEEFLDRCTACCRLHG